MDLEQIITDLIQKLERRFYGKYRGIVVDNADPKKLGRLKLQVPSVLGDEVVTGWALPCLPYGGDVNQGFWFIPEVGAGVWMEFEEGDLEFPLWVGTFWSETGGESEAPKPNDKDGAEQSSVQDPPTSKIIKTKKGHTIQLEDADGEEQVIIQDNQNKHLITLNSTGIKIQDGTNKNEMIFNSDGMSFTDANKNEMILNSDGMIFKDTNGNQFTNDNSGIIIEDANGNKITLDKTSGGIPGTPGIQMNGSKKVCLEGLINWLMAHTHIGNMGAPCPLNPADMAKLAPPALLDGNILSQKVKLG